MRLAVAMTLVVVPACSLFVDEPEPLLPKCGDTWTRSLGSLDDGADLAAGAVLDDSCNVIICGRFENNMTIERRIGESSADDVTLINQGLVDGMLAKFDASGGLVWAVSLGAGGVERCDAIAQLSDGSIAIAGTFRGAMSGRGFDLEIVSPIDPGGGADFDVFVARIEPTNPPTTSWVVSLASDAVDETRTLAVDSSDNLWLSAVSGSTITESSAGPVDFGTIHNTGEGAVIARLDSDGNILWGAHLGDSVASPRAIVINDIAFDTAGDPHLAVQSGGTNLGAQCVPEPEFNAGDDNNIFAARLDRDSGQCEWVAAIASGGASDSGRAIVVDDAGNAFLAGALQRAGTLVYQGGDTYDESVGVVDAFVARISVNGGHQWLRRFGSLDNDAFEFAFIDPNTGNLVLAGGYRNGMLISRPGPNVGDAEQISLSAPADGATNIVVAEYDRDGTFVSARTVGGADDDRLRGVAVAEDSLVLFGNYRGTFEANGVTLGDPGKTDNDMFITALPRE